MNDIKADVHDFLRNHEQRDMRFRMTQYNVVLMKAHFDEETDFVYMMLGYGDGDPLCDSMRLDNRPEFAGIYSISQDKVICPSYYFNTFCDAEKSENFRKEVVADVSSRIIELVNNQPVPVTKESDICSSRIEYYCERGAHEEALRWYFDENLPHDYMPYFDSEDMLDTRHLVKALNHRRECIEELAAMYIAKYANKINNRLEELKTVRAEYANLIKHKGDHFYQKRIAKAVENKDMKTVQLEIIKDGKAFSTKIETCVLCSTNCSGYTTWHMPAASRTAFERLYGRMATLMPCDIKRITYGRKTIYDAEKLEEEA